MPMVPQDLKWWWGRIRVHHKVWVVLTLLLGPLFVTLILLVHLIGHLLAVQESRHDLMLVRQEVRELRRLAVDIEDGFRGFLLTEQEKFLAPMYDAELRLPAVMARTKDLVRTKPEMEAGLGRIEEQLRSLLASKKELVRQAQQGRRDSVHRYVRGGEGLELSDAVRADLRKHEDRLDAEIRATNAAASGISERAYWSVLVGVLGAVVLGWLGARILSRSITNPLTILHRATIAFGREPHEPAGVVPPVSAIRSSDEIGQLARAYQDMNRRIQRHIRELEVLQTIGQEINTIAPHGLEGVLRRITDRAVDLVQADVCLVMLRDDRMGCWVIEAASGRWNEQLHKTVLLWEEFPISVRAFETGQPVAGTDLRADQRPELARRNLIGDSMLSVPLLTQGRAFGCLVLLSERRVEPEQWNRRLAIGLAQEAAVGISNARLYEAAQEKRKGLRMRLRQLEHLAEMLAHDLKGPGERMGQLAATLRHQYADRLDDRAAKWLTMIEQGGRDLTDRVEGILALARVGARQETVQAVDPNVVIQDLLKSRAGELEAVGATIHVQRDLPLVACQSAYLRQVFDNLLSNALKFARPGVAPEIRIEAVRQAQMVCWSFRDNGIGIPAGLREKVFLPFVRLNPSLAGGSGIGLTIVRRIVELYKGAIWIAEQVEPGTKIRFTLPILDHWQQPDGADTAGRSTMGRHARMAKHIEGV